MKSGRRLPLVVSASLVAVFLIGCADRITAAQETREERASLLAQDEVASKAGRVSLIVGWGSLMVVSAAYLLARKTSGRLWKTFVRLLLAALAMMPWCMLWRCFKYYGEATTDAGRTSIQWSISFWTVVCAIAYAGALCVLWARAYSSLRGSPESARVQVQGGADQGQSP